MTASTLVDELRAVFGDGLRTVALYGSAASAEEAARPGDMHVLVIVDALPLDRLTDAGAHVTRWLEGGHPAPLVLTETEWRASADIFPMEYADILAQRQELHGRLPVDGIVVEPNELRVAVEREAMGKLLQLRRGVIAAGDDAGRRAELLAVSLSTFLAVFRGGLRVMGIRPDPDPVGTCREVGFRAGLDPSPFLRVLDHKRGTTPLPPAEVNAVLAGYLTALERLVAWLDQLVPA
jgi:hypothetical protein